MQIIRINNLHTYREKQWNEKLNDKSILVFFKNGNLGLLRETTFTPNEALMITTIILLQFPISTPITLRCYFDVI